MKIKNNYVLIKTGNKTYKTQNLILDKYLEKIAERQSSFESLTWNIPVLSKCFLKFDKKLEFDETSVLSQSDFDFELQGSKAEQNNSQNRVEIAYFYGRKNNNINDRKITAIGFFDKYDDCYACLDTSNYSISVKNNEMFSIVRSDIFETEAILNSNSSKVNFPVHLSPMGISGFSDPNKTTPEMPFYSNTSYAFLSSVGVGTNPNIMQKEVLLDSDNAVFINNEIRFENIFSNENVLGLLEPGFRSPSSNLFPVDTENNFTYLFFKYKLYFSINNTSGLNYKHIDTGIWYTLSVPSPKNIDGAFNYAIKYERMWDYGIYKN